MKKKLMQATTTTLLASAALVVTSPAQTSAASNATDLVAKAKSSASLLKQYYNAEESTLTKEFLNAYNQAKANITKAENAGIKDTKLKAQLDSAKNELLKAARLIDAIKVGEQLSKDTESLKKYINKEELNDEMVEAYHQLSEQIRKAEQVFSKVYGEKSREAVRDEFLIGAKIAKESVIYEVSRYILQDQISKQIEKEEIAEAKENYAKLNRLERRAEEIKADGNKLYPGKYPQLSKMADSLTGKKVELRTNLTITIEAESTKQGEPTVYGSEELQKVEKDLVVTATEGTYLELRNLEVSGDIIIKGVNGSAGKVTLTNVNVTGTVKVDGEEEKKTLAANGEETLKQLQLFVDKQTQIKRLTLVNRTELTAESGAKINSVDITPAIPSHLFTLNGDLSSTNVTVKGKETEVKIGATAKILELLVNSKATIDAENGASLLSLLIDTADKNTEIGLKGDLSDTNVLLKNSNASVSIKAGTVVKKIEKDASVKDDIKIDNNGTVIDSEGVDVGNSSDYTPPISGETGGGQTETPPTGGNNGGGQTETPPTGGNTGGGQTETPTTGGEQTPAPTIQTVQDIVENVKKGESFNLPSEVEVNLSDGTKQNVEVVWEETAVDTSVLGTTEFYGTVEGYDEKVLLKLTVSPEGYTVKNDGITAVVTSGEAFDYAIEQNNITTIEISKSLSSNYSGDVKKKIVVQENIKDQEIDFNNATLSNVQLFGDNLTLKNATIINLSVEETVYNLHLENIKDGEGSTHTLNGGGGESIVLSGDTSFKGNIKITSGTALQIRTDSENAKIEGTILIESEAKTKIAAPVKNVVIGSGNEEVEINSTVDQLIVRNNANIKLGEGSNIGKATKRVGVEVTATNGNGTPIVFEEVLDKFELERMIIDADDILENAVVGEVEGNYSQASKDQLATAINQAKSVNDSSTEVTTTVQNQVDVATATLQEAINTFKNSVVTIDRSQLNYEWNRAQRVANRAIIGNNTGQYPQTAHDDLTSVIEEAKTMYETFGKTQAQIDAKVEELTQAIETFVDSKIGESDEDILHEGSISFLIKGEEFVSHYANVEIFPYSDQPGSNLEIYRDAEVKVESDGLKVNVTNIDETLAETFYATIRIDGYLLIEELTSEEIKSGTTKIIEVNEAEFAPINATISGVNQEEINDQFFALNPVDSEGNGMFHAYVAPDIKVPFGTYNIQYNAQTDSASYQLFKDDFTISATNQRLSFTEEEMALVDFSFEQNIAANFDFDSAVGLPSGGGKYDVIYHPNFADEAESLYLSKNTYHSIIQIYRVTKDGQTWEVNYDKYNRNSNGEINVNENMTISADDQLKVVSDTHGDQVIDVNSPLYYFLHGYISDGKGNQVYGFQKLHLNEWGYYDYRVEDRLNGEVTVKANNKTYKKKVKGFNFTELSLSEIVNGEELSGEIEIIFSVEDSPIPIAPFSKKFNISAPTTQSLEEAQASTQSASTLDLYAGFDVQDGTVKIS